MLAMQKMPLASLAGRPGAGWLHWGLELGCRDSAAILASPFFYFFSHPTSLLCLAPPQPSAPAPPSRRLLLTHKEHSLDYPRACMPHPADHSA